MLQVRPTYAERGCGTERAQSSPRIRRTRHAFDQGKSNRILILIRAAYVSDPRTNLAKMTNSPEFKSELTVQFALIGSDGHMIASNVGQPNSKVYLGDRAYSKFTLAPTRMTSSSANRYSAAHPESGRFSSREWHAIRMDHSPACSVASTTPTIFRGSMNPST